MGFLLFKVIHSLQPQPLDTDLVRAYNLYMDKLNKKVKVLEIVGILSIIVLVLVILKVSSIHSARVMEIDYCWDSNGQHYVAPNEMCEH